MTNLKYGYKFKMLFLTSLNKGQYMPFVRNDDGSLDVLTQVQTIIEKYPHYVVRNLKGDKVNIDFTEPYQPKSFADYQLYLFEHAFEGNIEKALMVFSFFPDEDVPCGVCGEPTKELYPEPLQKFDVEDEIIIYAICEDCWASTHLARIVDDDEVFADTIKKLEGP